MLGVREKVVVKTTLGFAAAIAVAIALSSHFVTVPLDQLHAFWWREMGDWMNVQLYVDRMYHGTLAAAVLAVPGLAIAVAMALLGVAIRTVVRARVRAGNRDSLRALRQWTRSHPAWTRALTALAVTPVAVAWALMEYEVPGMTGLGDVRAPAIVHLGILALYAIPMVFAAMGWIAVLRAGVASFAAPVVDDAEVPRSDVSGDEITFDAVAVTFETRAAVAAMLALSVAMVAFLGSLSATALFHDVRVMGAMAAYLATTLGGAALFRRASRIAIGVDGVYVTGTSRTRFFAYRDLDYVHPSGDDLVLVRGTRVALRLQLHGRDAMRREAVLERIRSAIRRVKEERHDAVSDYVTSASEEILTRAAHGAGDYRAPALSRERLWEMVEGPSIEAKARRTAAAALVTSGDAESRTRLRVTADNCADPLVRVALRRLAEGPDDEDDARAGELEAAEDEDALPDALPSPLGKVHLPSS